MGRTGYVLTSTHSYLACMVLLTDDALWVTPACVQTELYLSFAAALTSANVSTSTRAVCIRPA
jgi:hypothetical protein